MARMEGTRYSVNSELKDTMTVTARWARTPILLEVHCPRAVSIATTSKQQVHAAEQSAGAGIRKGKMTVRPCELSQTSNLPKQSRRTDPPTSSSHAEPRDHKANSGRREPINHCTLERLTTQLKSYLTGMFSPLDFSLAVFLFVVRLLVCCTAGCLHVSAPTQRRRGCPAKDSTATCSKARATSHRACSRSAPHTTAPKATEHRAHFTEDIEDVALCHTTASLTPDPTKKNMKLSAPTVALCVLDLAGTCRSQKPSNAMPCKCANCHIKRLSSQKPTHTQEHQEDPTPGRSH